jgi:hypothetical protein
MSRTARFFAGSGLGRIAAATLLAAVILAFGARPARAACSVDGAFIQGAKVTLARLGAPSGDDRVRLKGAAIIPQADQLDPESTGLRFTVQDGSGTALLDIAVPPGTFDPTTKSGWRSDRTRGVYGYRGDGAIARLALKARGSEVRFIAVGKQGSYSMPKFAPITLTLQAESPTALSCASAVFTSQPGEPGCVLLNGGQRVVCK